MTDNSNNHELMPMKLFTKATSVRLSGLMELNLARSLLHSIDPAKLVSLAPDNLLDCGKTPISTTIKPRSKWKNLNCGETVTEWRRWFAQYPTAQWPAVIRGLLRNLNGRCTSLKSLTLRKVGVISPAECHTYRYLEEAYLSRERSKFVRSVKATLEVFIFEHGTNLNFEQGKWVHPVRTMDWRFGLQIFLGIMCEPWPCLKRMEIRGVRSRRGHDIFLPFVSAKKQYGGRPFGVSIKDQIRAAIGPEVVLLVPKECRTFDDVEVQASNTVAQRIGLEV